MAVGVPRPRLLIADDHEMVGQAFQTLLTCCCDIVGIVLDGAEVSAAVQRCKPDLLLLDLSMPHREGLQILSDFSRVDPLLRILVVTMHADYCTMQECLRRGANGFIPKDCSSNDLITAIREVLAGKQYVSSHVPEPECPANTDRMPGIGRLTPRQKEIVGLIGQGMTSKEMAQILGVSSWTVHFHRKNIRRQLGIRSELEMCRYAVLAGMNSKMNPGRN